MAAGRRGPAAPTGLLAGLPTVLLAGLLAALLTVLLTTPAAALPPACAGAEAPPPPPAVEEAAAPPVAPLPWPTLSVGGPSLTACTDALPPGAPPPPADVTSAGWILADLDSGAVLAAHAPHARHRPASTLKVLSAFVSIERLDPDAVVAGAPEDLTIDGSKAGIGPGGTYTVRQLLAGLLFNSGNDTAQALARAVGGDGAMITAMADTAHRLGALDTRPATPSGLDGPGMASSAYDLALLFRDAMRLPLFAETIRTREVPFPGYGTRPGFTLSNANPLLARYPGSLGGKTGFTDAARHTIVGAAERDGRRLVVALVRGEQSPVPMWRQAAALLDYGFALTPGTPQVGVLVDTAPPDPSGSAGTSERIDLVVATLDGGRTPLGPVVAGAVGGLGVVGVLVLRRRRRARR